MKPVGSGIQVRTVFTVSGDDGRAVFCKHPCGGFRIAFSREKGDLVDTGAEDHVGKRACFQKVSGKRRVVQRFDAHIDVE